MTEEWRTIPGYKGQYEASSEGRLRRISGKRASADKPCIIRTFVGDYGYIRTAIMRDGKVYKPGVHILVAATFLGKCPTGHEVNHIDMDKTNNRPENLEYVSHADNLKQARAIKPWYPSSHKVGRLLTDDQVRDIRNSSLSQRALGARYGVSGVAIFHIRHRDTYKEVTDF